MKERRDKHTAAALSASTEKKPSLTLLIRDSDARREVLPRHRPARVLMLMTRRRLFNSILFIHGQRQNMEMRLLYDD